MILAYALMGITRVACADPLVSFSWSPLASHTTAGSTEVTVDILADQSGGADAAYFTLGIAFLGVVTDVELVQFGPDVSTGDSFYGTTAGVPVLVIAAAPADPGSFGVDSDLTVASVRIVLDTGLGDMGSVALVDVTEIAGAPALESDGVTAIAADLGATHVVTVNVLPAPECSNGIDDDGDGLVDYPNDLGCRSATSTSESPQCQDGIDNDGDGKVDFDGGASANHGVALAAADPQCGAAYRNSEKPGRCGLGAELILPLFAVRFLARRQRTAVRGA